MNCMYTLYSEGLSGTQTLHLQPPTGELIVPGAAAPVLKKALKRYSYVDRSFVRKRKDHIIDQESVDF